MFELSNLAILKRAQKNNVFDKRGPSVMEI